MPTYNISVDLSPLVQGLSVASNELALRIAQSVKATAQQIHDEWIESTKTIPGLSAEQRIAYLESIKIHSVSDFESEVISNYRYAADIDNGRPARDLKNMLNTSTKVRISAKNGQRYLIIPMRHLVKNQPANVQKVAGDMDMSNVTKTNLRLSGLNAYNVKARFPLVVPKNVTQWGQRLGAGFAPKLQPHHKTDPFAGMVRMNTSSKNAKSSAYLTFRVMTESSQGWIVPAQPGLFIVRGLVDRHRPLFQETIEQAVKSVMPL